MMTLRITLFLILSFLFIHSKAQWINSITISPVNPTEIDTINFYIDLSFPSGPCDDKTISTGTIPPNFFASALHCLGPLTVICNHTDTITYYQLPPGNYNFTFQVDAGYGPSPCTPGIVPGPTDNINFTVLPVVSINDLQSKEAIQIFPNPAGNYFNLKCGTSVSTADLQLKIYSVDGKLLKEINYEQKPIDVSEFENGLYFIKFFKNDMRINNYKFIINK